CWGAAATFGKLVFTGRLFAGPSFITPVMLTQARTTFAAILLSAFLLLRNDPGMFKLNRRDLGLCALTGTLGLAGSNFFYYWAIQKTTVAVAITVQYTAPIWVLLFMVARKRQSPTLLRLFTVLLALAGVALVIGLFSSQIKLNALGVAAALLAAFSFSFYNIAGQGLVARNHPLKIMNYTLLSSAVLWLIVNPPWKILERHYTHQQWGFLLLFALLSMLLPYIFYFNGLKYLDPTRAVVTSCLEPVFAIIFAALFIGETVHGSQVVGIIAVLTATIMAQMKQANPGNRPTTAGLRQ
ncbi:MAG TPA: EamA family transporter, partial [Candidatus Angelobacter sp.]